MTKERLLYVHIPGLIGDILDGLLWIISFGCWTPDLGFRIRLKNSMRLLRRKKR
jgi:hypothetical protein